MSNISAQTLWMNTQIKLSHILKSDLLNTNDFNSNRQANDYVRYLFITYIDIMKKLDEIYQTLIHPQKRLIIRNLLDGIVGRIVELKQEMIKFDYCEYTYFEDLALDHKKTLDDVYIDIPRYFMDDCIKSIEERNETINNILKRLNESKTDRALSSSIDCLIQSNNYQINTITLASAVRTIQAHERARQARVHAYSMRQIKHESKMKQQQQPSQNHNLDQSCLIIQTIWRQKYAEKLFHIRKLNHMKLLDMYLPRKSNKINDVTNMEKCYLQIEYKKEYDEASDDVKEKVRQNEETEMKSRLEFVLTQWLLESRQLYGQFPIYPSKESKGSKILFKDMKISDIEEFVYKQSQMLKNRKKKKIDIKQKPKISKSNKVKHKLNLNQLESSKFIPIINNQMIIYKDSFYERDESYNKDQHYDILLMMDKFRPDVENELQVNVDTLLRNELTHLKLAIDNVEDKQIHKNTKRKKKKVKRKKKSKDIIFHRTNESIFEELVETGIILPTKSVTQCDFIADHQYLSETIRHNEKEPMPSLLDCQQLVILQIIFPLCSQMIHVNLPRCKPILLAGPSGSGKELLIHIACNHLGALLFDLSLENIAKSFNTIDGIKILFAMIERLVLTMPPIICMIRDTEIFFSKNLTSHEKSLQPNRLKRLLIKFVKKFKPGQRILFVGLSSQPYRIQLRASVNFYEHIILFPRPNYGTRRKIFYEILIEKYHMNINDVELSLVSSLSNGYTAGQIVDVITKVIQRKNEEKYPNRMCTAKDFIPLLGMKTPIFIDEENKIKNWYSKTLNGIKRLNNINQMNTANRSYKNSR